MKGEEGMPDIEEERSGIEEKKMTKMTGTAMKTIGKVRHTNVHVKDDRGSQK